MADEMPPQSEGFLSAFAHPAWVLMMVAQMLLGLALFLALVLKYYMLVFGTEVCVPNIDTLSNMVRCASALEITAHTVLGVAGFRLAACLFVDNPRGLLLPLMIGVVGMIMMYVSGVTVLAASWSVAAVLLALMICLMALFAAIHLKLFAS
ncbi:MAG: hypothetical protein ABJ327_23940 [Litoreibacter sp.]